MNQAANSPPLLNSDKTTILLSTRPSSANFPNKQAELWSNNCRRNRERGSSSKSQEKGENEHLKHQRESQTSINEYRLILWERRCSLPLLLSGSGRKELQETRQIMPGSAVQGSSCPQILTGGNEPGGHGSHDYLE